MSRPLLRHSGGLDQELVACCQRGQRAIKASDRSVFLHFAPQRPLRLVASVVLGHETGSKADDVSMTKSPFRWGELCPKNVMNRVMYCNIPYHREDTATSTDSECRLLRGTACGCHSARRCLEELRRWLQTVAPTHTHISM